MLLQKYIFWEKLSWRCVHYLWLVCVGLKLIMIYFTCFYWISYLNGQNMKLWTANWTGRGISKIAIWGLLPLSWPSRARFPTLGDGIVIRGFGACNLGGKIFTRKLRFGKTSILFWMNFIFPVNIPNWVNWILLFLVNSRACGLKRSVM